MGDENVRSRPPSVGHAWLVGAGPGDPGLLTVAGARALAAADTVLYDALVSPSLLHRAKPGARLVHVGKRAGAHAMRQEEVEAALVAAVMQGEQVVRLKGGDPFLFGRGGEEALACRRAGIPFTIIPGVTSAIAAPAYAGIPATHRGLASDLLVLTAHAADAGTAEDQIDWAAAARAGTLVILMGLGTIEDSMARLAAAGRDPATPAAVVSRGTLPGQRTVTGTIATIARLARKADLEAPAITVVGPTVALARDLAWFLPGPLAGRTVAITRARGRSARLACRLEGLGATVVEAPVIETRPRVPNPALCGALAGPPCWVVFSSAAGVESAFAALGEAGLDARAFAGHHLAAVGEATAVALREHGLRADFVPSRATAACLAAELPLAPGGAVLLAASALADGSTEAALRARGAAAASVAVHDTISIPLDTGVREAVAAASAVTFASASAVRALRAALGDARLAPGTKLVSIGPSTSAALASVFGRIDAEAAAPGLEALAAAVVECLA